MKEQNNSSKRTKQNGDKQCTRCRVRNTDNKDARWSQRELQQRVRKIKMKIENILKKHSEMNEEYIRENHQKIRWSRILKQGFGR